MADILVNDRLLRHPLTGIGYYLASLVSAWPAQGDVRLVGFHSQRLLRRQQMSPPAWLDAPPARPSAIGLRTLRQLVPPQPHALRRWLGWTRPARDAAYRWLMRRDFRRHGYAAFFEPNCLPICECDPLVTTMSDLSVLECPQYHPPERVAVWERGLANAVRWTRHWLCFSNATAHAMERLLGLPAKRISVIPLASRWADLPSEWETTKLHVRLGLPKRYIVAVGTIEPRKNLLTLLDAYAHRPRTWRARTPLILVGMPGWGNPAFWRALRDHRVADEVFITGYLPDRQAAAVVAGARALFFPSFYEGFGLPVLEGMSLGVPVAASTAESVREVAGDAALLLDANDITAWSEAMERLTEAGLDRNHFATAGQQHSQGFRWDTSARRHQELFARLTTGETSDRGRLPLFRGDRNVQSVAAE